MHLWLISSSYPRNPTESINAGVVARDLALTLAADGHRVSIITPDKPGGVEFDRSLCGVPIPWFRPSVEIADISRSPADVARSASLLVSAWRTVRRESASNPPDGIIALWGLPSGLFAKWGSRISGAPYVLWLLGSDVWRASEIPFGVSTLRKAITGAVRTFADGRKLAMEAENLTGRPIEFLPSIRRLPEPSSRPDISGDALFVGRYHRNKGPDVLVDAIAILKGRGQSIRLAMHGLGDMEQKLRDRVRRKGIDQEVSVLPPIDAQELADRLASARFLIIPSRIESVPLVLGDAVQSRTPVIVSDVGDMGELVKRFELGITVPPEDPVRLADAIAKMMASETRPRWSEADASFSVNSLADQLLAPIIEPLPQ